MNRYGRCVLTAAVLLAAYVVLLRGLGLLNRASDLSFYSGMALVFALFALMPLVIRRVWRKRQ